LEEEIMGISRELRIILLSILSLISMGQAGPSGGGAIGFLLPLIIIAIIAFGIFRFMKMRQANNPLTSAEPKSGDIEFDFKTLLGFGKFISGLGWILVIIGGILALTGLTNSGNESLFFILGGLVLAIMGLFMVANGQLISCFVSIERNTRQASDLLKQQSELKEA